jgi:uncharacterized protein
MEVTKQLLVEMVSTKMPFGQYEDMLLCNLPVSYLEGFNNLGFPSGKLGMLLQTLYEMKLDGTEHVLEAFKQKTSL